MIADEWKAPDTWISVYEHSGTVTYVDVAEEHCLDAAITAFLDSGKTRDQLLSLRMIEGDEYRVPVSGIRAYFKSTPEFRRRNTMTVKFQREETREVRAELGLPYKEDDD